LPGVAKLCKQKQTTNSEKAFNPFLFLSLPPVIVERVIVQLGMRGGERERRGEGERGEGEGKRGETGERKKSSFLLIIFSLFSLFQDLYKEQYYK